ncbi:YafY family protein [Lactiplantibacillus plantarum]|uniref:helix-turn-helix transcriptional regulator n=1 Tax=Lactiplantibacillus plantarum TaxID=1590 RepID=UPI000FF8D876|nr:WYL domain-containing protein [Lactiplantibacillus plantarum]MBP5835405.1 WYL domain-containing protein [Lactiplantibacillus plantarum]MBU7470388.1 WYL domain-containing protein [Lactiplantibacillus plantarum]QAR90290.1 WYL domain-containing protein [Lactiplantibacillus plantarum]
MNATYRQLYIFQLLISDHLVNKTQLAEHFAVNPRAIQRDISQIKTFITDQQLPYQLTYRRQLDGYQLATAQDHISKLVILTLIKILLASRSLNQDELRDTVTGLMGLVSKSEQAEINPIVKNEVFHYQPVHHQQPLLKLIWQISQFIITKQTINIDYRNSQNQTETRTILPQAIIFSEYYFYVVAYSTKYHANRFFRLDRIFGYHVATQKIHRSRAERVSDGELRQYIHYMQPGKKTTIRFEFTGIVEAALDRFPTAKVITAKSSHHKVLIEAEVFDTGAMMWLLSQGARVRVVSPDTFVRKMRDVLKATLDLYQPK